MEIISNLSQSHTRNMIKVCQNENHIQQVAYSTYHDALTQICFTCNIVRTSMKKSDYGLCVGEEE